VQLLFEGGPWANRLLDSAVTTAPEIVAPDVEQGGAYRRADQPPDSQVVIYEWLPNSSVDSPATALVESPRGSVVGGQCGMRFRFGFEVVGAVSALVLAIVTLFWADWIEHVFRIDPDSGGGALEWVVVFALAVVSIGLTFAARYQWRRLTIAA
jgi:hypothetical protein